MKRMVLFILIILGALGATWASMSADNGLDTFRDVVIVVLAIYSIFYYRRMKAKAKEENNEDKGTKWI